MHRLDKRVALAAGLVALVVGVLAVVLLRSDEADTVIAGSATDAVTQRADEAEDAGGREGGELAESAESAESAEPDGPDGDLDADGVTNLVDLCPETPDPDQLDGDGDGVGDACDAKPDDGPPGDSEPEATPPATQAETDSGQDQTPGTAPRPEGAACILYLHGAGTTDAGYVEDWADEGILFLVPQSPNAEWPHFWLYDGQYEVYTDSDAPFDELTAFLTAELDRNNCGPVMLYGASNGAGFAAKLYCRGQDFGGRVWSVMVDDPVPDAGVVGCSPSPSVQRTLFTHSAEIAGDAELFEDDRCSRSPTLRWPWYCEDDIGFGVAEYEAHIAQTSHLTRDEHVGANPPEYNFWNINLSWWYDYDPERFPQLELR
jgi:hypothetical protein